MQSRQQESIPISCPPSSVWIEVAAGLMPEDRCASLVSHAAECRRCAVQLAEALRITAAEEDDDEKAMLSTLQTSNPEWQRKTALRLQTAAVRPQRSGWSRRLWALAAAAAVCVTVWNLRQPSGPPLQLLARAYTVHRPFVLRVPGAAYPKLPTGPRGSEKSAFDDPGELATSQTQINSYMETHPANAEWLLAKGRLDLLRGNYEAAAATLRTALDDVPTGKNRLRADILIDRATAEFQQYKAGKLPKGLELAFEMISEAVKVDANRPEAHFNRAVLAEEMADPEVAIQEWRTYLKLDPTGGWADEARGKLNHLLGNLHGVLRGPEGLRDLPEVALSERMAGNNAWSRHTTLAAEMALHGDHWLEDAEQSGREEDRAVLQLAARNRLTMHSDGFPEELKKLRRLSVRKLAAPDEAWSDYEQLFRETHGGDVVGSERALDSLVGLCRTRNYVWLEIQALLERASAETADGKDSKAYNTILAAEDQARRHGLAVSEMRAAGYLCSWLAHTGQYREAVAEARVWLGKFWSRPYPLERSQEFYNDLGWVFEGLGLWHAAAAAAEMASSVAHRVGWISIEATDRARWAGFAQRAGLRDVAAAQFALSKQLFQFVEPSTSTAQFRAFADAADAELQGNSGELARWRGAVEESSNPIVSVVYLRTMAGFEAKQGQVEQAEKDLKAALARLSYPEAHPRGGRLDRTWRFELDRSSRQLVALELAKGNKEAALRVWRDFQAADIRLQGTLVRPVTQAVQRDPAIVVTFANLDGRYAAWIRRSGELRAMWLPGTADDMDLLVRRFVELCSRPARLDEGTRDGLSKELSHRLLDSTLGAEGTEKAVVIQPDGALASLPWPALPLQSGGLLGDRLLVVEDPMPLPDGPALLPVTAVHRAMIVAAPELSGDLASEYSALPDVAGEVAAVQEALPGSRTLEGAMATARRIEDAWGDTDVFHFAGHTSSTGDRIHLMVARDAALADSAAGQGYWQPHLEGGPRFSLAVLSACSTARDQGTETTAPSTLAAEFLQAGTRQVVASLWDADSRATAQLMRFFYRGLRDGHGAAAALEAARREVHRTPGWEDPYYWAPFVLFVQI